MINAEEKMKLMIELGLESAAVKWAEANNLTNLKFRPITEEKIESLLTISYPQKRGFDGETFIATGIVGMIISILVSIKTTELFNYRVCLPVMACATVIGYILSRPRTVRELAEVCDMPLVEWEDNLPYGALLAVKEAKAQGFKDFDIYFPAKQGSYYGNIQRLKNDPIIVATKKNSTKMYNIFAWDDGKVYE